MYLYSTDNTIKKYSSPEEILQEYYIIRLEYYQKRKDALELKIKEELDILKYKVKFIESIMNDELIIFKKTRKIIIELLEENNYPPFLINGPNISYNYLLDMKIDSFSKEKIDKLKAERDNKLSELDELLQKDKFNLWNDDLDAFKKAYKIHLNEYEQMKYYNVKDTKKKKIIKKKTK